MHKAPNWCTHPMRHSCRHCPESMAPELFDGGCKNLFGERAPAIMAAWQADHGITATVTTTAPATFQIPSSADPGRGG